MTLRPTVLLERLRSNLFVVPVAFVAGAVVLAVGMITVDDRLGPSAPDLPFVIASTVDSARAILTTVATATITVAGIAFSISLLVIQMASSQYSPRAVHGIFRDNTNKLIIGVVVGTFTYCLIVLQAVRGETSEGGEDIVPNISVLVALILGVVAVLAIVAFINHNAHAMEVSELLQDLTDQAVDAVRSTWPVPDEAPPPLPQPDLGRDGYVVDFDASGWIQHVDLDDLRAAAPPGGTVRFESGVGRYAVAGVPLCTIWPVPPDPDSAALTDAVARGAVHVGRARTIGQDPAYGLRQLADVGIRALSAGIDDPTTAQDAIFHLAAVLREMHRRVPPAPVTQDDERRTLVLGEAADHRAMVDLAFEELRRSARSHPSVSVYLLEAMSLLCRSVDPEAPDEAREALRAQADLVLAESDAADLVDADHDLVRAAHRNRFDEPAG